MQANREAQEAEALRKLSPTDQTIMSQLKLDNRQLALRKSELAKDPQANAKALGEITAQMQTNLEDQRRILEGAVTNPEPTRPGVPAIIERWADVAYANYLEMTTEVEKVGIDAVLVTQLRMFGVDTPFDSQFFNKVILAPEEAQEQELEDYLTNILPGEFVGAMANDPRMGKNFKKFQNNLQNGDDDAARQAVVDMLLGIIDRHLDTLDPCESGEAIAHLLKARQSIKAGQEVAGAIEAAKSGDWVTALKTVFTVVNRINQIAAPCFTAGTPLLTPTGEKFIEEFQPGDLILTRNENDVTAPVVERLVEEVFVRTGRVLNVHVHGQVIRTKPEHPFWVGGKGWTPGGRLQIGDCFVSHDGQTVVVNDLLDTGEYETVYNLRVAEHHTYFVGSRDWGFSVWVHNECVEIHEVGTGKAKRYVLRNQDGSRVLKPDKTPVEPFMDRDEARGWAEGNGLRAQDIIPKPPLDKPVWTNGEIERVQPPLRDLDDGKWHGPVPPRVPTRWEREDLLQAERELEGSIQARKQATVEKGQEANHAVREQQERTLLEQVRKKLADPK